ncbi:hypothetical protein QJS04_geneDACA010462 [Acorus gramineus]|uniref:Tryptophan synthase beta chain-like PALP domain-containing protein n=1 Tax=Acorus gramineus TaxID=55184 RepID=A0AAV9ALV1_ACOGR|nr:hypothetical protein QJS04_geneDACA010462 [Acorus gramineus]
MAEQEAATAATAMEGRRGLPSLLASSSVEANEDFSREHIASSVTQLIGWTPLIELKRIVEKEELDVRLVGKMIEDAEEKGLITPGVTTLVEPTSGNLGIALAYIAALKGPEIGFEGIFDRVNEIKASIPNAYFLDQLSNPANPEAHFLMTGPEIWKDTAGKVDIFVAGSGTGGTISGTGKYLKTKNPAVKVIYVEPAESPLISGDSLLLASTIRIFKEKQDQKKHEAVAANIGTPCSGHESSRRLTLYDTVGMNVFAMCAWTPNAGCGSPGKHNIQGIGPPIIPTTLDKSIIDEVITVTTEEAMSHARRLAKEEGLLVGISSGAALAACLKVARRRENKGKMIVTIFPSGGERYLSTDLFAQVREECMDMSP